MKMKPTPELDAAHATWHDEKPDLARQPITQHVVYEICWRLIKAGIQPTNDAVRYVHGGGSPNTIQPLIKSFFTDGELENRWKAPVPHDVPDKFTEAWDLALRQSRSTLEIEFEADEAALGRERAELVAHQINCDAKVTSATQHAAAAIEGKAVADKRVADMQESLRALRGRLASELRSKRKDAQAHDDTVRYAERLERERAELQKAKDVIDSELQGATKESELLRHELQAQALKIDGLKESAEITRAQHRSRVADFEAQLKDVQQRVTDLVEQRADNTRLLAKTRDELDATAKERDGLRSSLAQAQDAAHRISVALAAVESRATELERTRVALVSALDTERSLLVSLRDTAAADGAKWRELIADMQARKD